MSLSKFISKILIATTIFLAACSFKKNEEHRLQLNSEKFSTQIIGGNVVTNTNYTSKFVVGLFAPRFGSCSGVIIAPDLILTAAHCIPPNPKALTVIFDTNLNTASQLNMRAVINAKVTPYWNPNTPKNKNKGDLALVRIQGDLPHGYRPAPLLTNPQFLGNNSLTLIAGFGLSSYNRQASTSGVLRETFTPISQMNYSETEVLLSQIDGRGTCSGDSGGPAFILINGIYYVWGITSHGDNDCVTFGVYTNLVVYVRWIQKTAVELRLKGL